jgi:hypothetical protein
MRRQQRAWPPSLRRSTVVVLTNAPLHPDTRSGKDFVIIS